MKPGDRVFVKSPFENVFNLLNAIPQGHEKALKHALYNAVATLLLVVCIAAAFGLFYILEPFVKPLIWALLVGSVLHPFKRSIEKKFEAWLDHVDDSPQPLIVAIIMIPIHVVDDVSETIGRTLRRYLAWLISLCIATLLVFVTYTYIPNVFLSTAFAIWTVNCNTILWLLHNITPTMFITLSAIYIGVLCLCWSKDHTLYFTLGSYAAWFITASFLARSIGIFTVTVFIFFIICLIVGFAYEVSCIYESSKDESYLKTILKAAQGHDEEALKTPEEPSPSQETEEQVKKVTEVARDGKESAPFHETPPLLEPKKWQSRTKPSHMPGLLRATPDLPRKSDPEIYVRRKFLGSGSGSAEDETKESSRYIYAVIWACGFILLWRNIWLVHLLPIPISLYLIKRIGFYFGIWSVVLSQFYGMLSAVQYWVKDREYVLFPAPIQGLFKLSRRVRGKLMEGVRESISSFSSTLVILGLILFVFCFSSFLLLKIYAEGIHMLAVGASVINSTVVHNPEFLQLLPEGWSDKMESMLNNAYIYGREGISKQLRSMMKDMEPSKSAELEKHVLEFWDRVYQAWLMSAVETSHIGPKVPTSAVATSWQNFLEIVQKTPGVLNMSLVTEFLKDNLETLFSLLESVWALLKGNVSLVFHFLFAVISVLLGGGSAVLNFLLNGIVFFTALFYLLSSSRDLYKPVDLLSNFSPVNGNKVGVAFEAAINGVFKASFKMALFYGLWTWLIHNLFQVRIIYLPSVLAAVLGAVPFLGTYWASIPAVLDLWLAQEQGMLALALLIFQCLPMSFVDTAIYMEIRGGGHPYMTGLAIAGGVFCMGIQGAIFGPLLLCCLLVALNMSSSLMRESPDPSLSMRHQLRSREDEADWSRPTGISYASYETIPVAYLDRGKKVLSDGGVKT